MSRNMGQEWGSTPRAAGRVSANSLWWAAGFLEGEGSFYISKAKAGIGRRKTASVSERVTATQVQREPLERLQHMFGGSIASRERAAPRQRQHDWTVCGARARGVMMTLYQLMSPRRRGQIKSALSAVAV